MASSVVESTHDRDEQDDQLRIMKQQLRDVDRKLAEMIIPIGTPMNPLPNPCYLTKAQRERHLFALKLSNELYYGGKKRQAY